MQKLREEADYNRYFSFEGPEAAEEVVAAEAFLTEARRILAGGGWLPQEP